MAFWVGQGLLEITSFPLSGPGEQRPRRSHSNSRMGLAGREVGPPKSDRAGVQLEAQRAWVSPQAV